MYAQTISLLPRNKIVLMKITNERYQTRNRIKIKYRHASQSKEHTDRKFENFS